MSFQLVRRPNSESLSLRLLRGGGRLLGLGGLFGESDEGSEARVAMKRGEIGGLFPFPKRRLLEVRDARTRSAASLPDFYLVVVRLRRPGSRKMMR
jgi:hypothetical protein